MSTSLRIKVAFLSSNVSRFRAFLPALAATCPPGCDFVVL